MIDVETAVALPKKPASPPKPVVHLTGVTCGHRSGRSQTTSDARKVTCRRCLIVGTAKLRLDLARLQRDK